MGWIYLFLASIFEIAWAFGLKFSEGLSRPLISVLTLLFAGICFFLFAKTLKIMPIGVSYAIFTGAGTAGTSIISMIFLAEPVSMTKIFFLVVLITGIIGLQISTFITEESKETMTGERA